MEIFVLRHGRTGFNERGLINGFLDDELIAEGREQTKAAALLVPATVRRIYSSPLARTRETAELVNEQLHATLTFHEELKEVNFGGLNGTAFLPELRQKHETLTYDWRPSGECMDDVRTRVIKILRQVGVENAGGEALIVTHGGVIRMLSFLESETYLGRIENAELFTFDLAKILKNIA